MARQSTLFGGAVELPSLKRRRSGSSGSESSEDINRKKREVFKDGWKEKAPWPWLQGVDLPNRVQAELPVSWLEYKAAEGMYCKYRVLVLLLGRMSHAFS